MRTFTGVLAGAAAAFLAATALAAAGRPSSASAVTVRSSAYGPILFDGRGFALYAFTRDGHGASRCSGACVKAWPPFIVTGRPSARSGAHRSLIGTVKRADGKVQAAYAGRPLYYYAGDRRPGQVLCQNVAEFGGTWLVLRATGRLVH